MKRFFTLSVLALLGLAALLYFFRLQTGVFLFTRLLQQAGMKDIQLELTVVNAKEIVFSRADCTMNGNRISLRNAGFSWNSAALFQKRLDAISIDTLIVELEQKNQLPPKKKYSPGQITKQVELIRQRLPFRNLFIRHLTISGPATAFLAEREFTLRLQKLDLKIVGELSLNDRNLKLTLNSPEADQWNLNLNEAGQPEPVFSARIHRQADLIRAEIEADPARFKLFNALLNRPLPELKGKLSGTLSLSLKKERSTDFLLNLEQAEFGGTTAASVKVALHGRMDTPGSLILEKHSSLEVSGLQQKNISIAELTIGLDGVLERTDGHWRYIVNPEAMIKTSELKSPNLDIESVEIRPVMSAMLSEKKIILNLEPEWRMHITDVQAGSMTMAAATLQPEQNTEIAVSLNDAFAWIVAPSHWQLITKTLKLQNFTLDPGPITIGIQQLTGIGKNQLLQAELTGQYLRLTNKDVDLSIQDIRAAFTADAGKITGKTSFSSQTIPGALAIKFSHNLKKGTGKAAFHSEKAFSFSEMTPLRSILTHKVFAGDLTGGQLLIKGAGSWQQKKPVQLSLQANLSQGKGNFKDILFSGLAIQQDLQILPTIQSGKIGSVAIDTVETGVTVKNIAMETAFARSAHGKIPQIIIRNLSASLFDGTVSDEFLVYDPQQPEVESTIHLNNIDLARLITIQQVKGLEVTGQIEGSLPFFLDRTGLRIDRGTLKNAAGGGLIRYTLAGNNGLKDSPLTGYALKALEEFHYSLLSATAQYSPDGELQLNLHLEGKSPKLETNRPVHLNINTKQNLLSLLKSLRYNQSLTDEIDKEVQHHYQNPTP